MHKKKYKRRSLNPTLRTILEGVYDDGSPLSALLGTPHIVQNIWRLIKVSQHRSHKFNQESKVRFYMKRILINGIFL